ncbi:MAG: pyrroline-5-carboxylate reductase [Deltaproteobacteria bacterium]|nr:pyrroline-5-carboxylate reductase [Deltaproteobacteria bacterium]
MLTKKTIGFIGAGNLAEALIKGLLSSGGVNAGQLSASDTASGRLAYMAGQYEIKVYSGNAEVVRNSDVILLAVKPKDIGQALADTAVEITADKLVVSAAAGITTGAILELLRSSGLRYVVPIVRAMPNTPALVREGATALCAGAGANKPDVKLASAIFEAVGKVVVMDDERLMDAVTGLSGSGPAYVFLFMEALIEAGVEAGIRKEDARLLAMQTTLGAAALALESPLDLTELRRMVTSPGGTTIEGLKKLEKGRFKETVIKAVEAAAKRAGEIAKGN